MAIAFIREIVNMNPDVTLRIRVMDDNRHPTWQGVEYGKEDWLQINRPPSANVPTVVTPDNMAVPWSYGGKQRMYIQTVTTGGIVKNISAEVRGENAWDYMVLRDNALAEIGQTEIGSLGDAPGVNHSWWAIVLQEDGRLEWRLFERQGLRRDDLINIVTETGKFLIDVFPTVIDKAAQILPVIAAL
ncbi:MAG: hypothetical protein JO171_00880 [Paludibacterium sp.]|uniref:hypothetical protein n=1 Tax=Paludibacterium sp. TaxID=1917523 RepID=UPI0025D0F5C8|nr:hypothetical protein [Paludibacterium sp.]MBV8045678.1 hypothetical protein [Paludibacterium sp.]MBV8649522.1 hypothetical protein [Paludibacterium sp.]